ncbi:hypothetical protein [Leptolyngbya sp. GGD]|uniref:hypothetical protein n=1 Tax=Leptolyngbya sp. GGD TaxID=2997907 RepID=UPI00227AB71B|nr:hypothetical protein [Leptolyngbya sp. GGD]MCY6492100.1 hypothetical protein [Leptolyngbya sp. GGD]
MDQIQKINDRLKAACVRVRVIPKGKNLGLRATLPKKPQDGIGRKQYDISLRIPASKDGFKRAEREAYKLAQSLADGSFSWDVYLTPDCDPNEKTISQLIEEFKAEYFRTHPRIKETTWNNTWASTFRKLPQNGLLSDSMVLAVVLSTKDNSRNRELTCERLQKFGEFAGLTIDLSNYVGDYEPKPRDIPDDATIIEWRDKIPNEQWQWAYGAIAAFGIRPHEVFACEMIDPLTLRVHKDTKTGARTTRAILPEWAEKWNLIEMNPPETTQTDRRLRGQLVSHQFGSDRYNLPFHPYDLRHAWALRASVIKGLPISTAASMMGHGSDVHTRIYHRWLNDAQNERVYRSLILKQNG